MPSNFGRLAHIKLTDINDLDPFEGIDKDPVFDDVGASPDRVAEGHQGQEVHIRIQQRTTKKALTLVQGLPPKLNMKKVASYFKKTCCCNGTIVEDDSYGKILQLTGDQRQQVRDFLVEQKICPKELVKIHGVL